MTTRDLVYPLKINNRLISNQSGFSLIELMVVVGIIGIVMVGSSDMFSFINRTNRQQQAANDLNITLNQLKNYMTSDEICSSTFVFKRLGDVISEVRLSSQVGSDTAVLTNGQRIGDWTITNMQLLDHRVTAVFSTLKPEHQQLVNKISQKGRTHIIFRIKLRREVANAQGTPPTREEDYPMLVQVGWVYRQTQANLNIDNQTLPNAEAMISDWCEINQTNFESGQDFKTVFALDYNALPVSMRGTDTISTSDITGASWEWASGRPTATTLPSPANNMVNCYAHSLALPILACGAVTR